MKKLIEIFKEKDATFSLELFPPKTEKGYQNLLNTIEQLVTLKPDFISCTYGAGGGSRGKTLDIVQHIQDKHNVPTVAHLTCVCNTKDEIKDILNDIKTRGVSNVLALRGDPPQDNPDWAPGENNFKYSSELCAFIRKEFGDYFGIGVAGFPEGHPDAPSKKTDREFLKNKIDSGADYVLSQLFFNNQDYFDYVDELKASGVTAKVIPGILPITNYKNLIRFCETCKATVSDEVKEIFEPVQNDLDKTLEEGIKFAVRQGRDLLAGGAPGLHFYSLNKIHPVDEIIRQIKK